MEQLSVVISCLLLTVAAVSAQTGGTQMNKRPLPQWLTGIIAVSGFLFLAFVTFLVKKAWCDESSRRKMNLDSESGRENEFVMTNRQKYETTLNTNRIKADINVYNNLVINTDDKVTAM